MYLYIYNFIYIFILFSELLLLCEKQNSDSEHIFQCETDVFKMDFISICEPNVGLYSVLDPSAVYKHIKLVKV